MKYIGNHSVDAELELDFEGGVINMDYTNSFYRGCTLDSNRMLTLESKRLVSKPLTVLYDVFNITIIYIFLSGLLTTIKMIVERLFNGLWKKYDLQYYYQYAMKELVFMYRGFNEETKRGELETNTLCFNIPNNLYFEYELLGDYSHEIKNIKLERRFVKVLTPVREKIKQDGWSIVCNFTNPPKHGECKIIYTR